MLSNEHISKSEDVVVNMTEDEVDGYSDSELTLTDETFDILDAEDDFEKKTITKIFNYCRNGEIKKLKTMAQRTNKKRFKKWLVKSHDDKASYICLV